MSPEEKVLRTEWETPQALFDILNEATHFTVDVAASEKNTKCTKFYSKEQSGLEQSWKDEVVWCNPPYDDIETWVNKALNSQARVVIMLLPARMGSSWALKAFYHVARFVFIRGRVQFVPPEGVQASSNAEDSMLLVLSKEIGNKSTVDFLDTV